MQQKRLNLRIRRTNILLVATLLMQAMDCFAQKPMSLKLLKQQDRYVLDSREIPMGSEETYRVVSPTTDKSKVSRLWMRNVRVENMSSTELNFPNLQELMVSICYIPKDLTQYPLLQVLYYDTDEEVCLGDTSNDDYVNLMVSPLPEQIFQLENLKILELSNITSITF